MAEMIRGCPLEIIDRRDKTRFEPTAFTHLVDRQSFAPLTAMSFGKIRERAALSLKAGEPLEHRVPQRRREATVHLGDVGQFFAPAKADEDPVEVAAAGRIPTDDEIASLQNAVNAPI